MAKVIVERPRLGHSMGRVRPGRFAPLQDDDGEPLRARGPVRERVWKTKTLNENLAPLKRYLRSQANRPWSKVFSEISAHLRPTSTVQQHVRDHIEDFVAVRTRMKDGAVVTLGHGWRGGETPLTEDRRELYVHPRTGLLLRNPHWKSWARVFKEKQRSSAAPQIVALGAFRVAVRLPGGWHEANLEPIPAQPHAGPFSDAIFGVAWSGDLARARYGRADVFAETLRRLSAAERKALGLTR
ncbi:MAG: hypothetical protein NW203_00115 [Hyphomonadaceae bacterium]|nr:hypothetical protein [Hyphomonadaceae bacterium]